MENELTSTRTTDFAYAMSRLQQECHENKEEVARRINHLIDVVSDLYPTDMATMAALFLMGISGVKLVESEEEEE